MIRKLATMVAVAALLVLPAMPARATTTTVTVAPSGNLVFSPSNVTIAVADYIHWTKASTGPQHNVHQDLGLFHSGSPTTGTINYTQRFSAGTFHYYCQVHGSTSGGMSGLIHVPVLIMAAPTGLPFTVEWSANGVQTGTYFDVEYRIGTSGSWTYWKVKTTSRAGVFGASGSPVKLHHGATYFFKARSWKTFSGAKVHSGFSPIASFAP